MSNLTIHSENAAPNNALKKVRTVKLTALAQLQRIFQLIKVNIEAALNQATKATQSTIVEYHFIIGKNFTVTGALDLKPVTVESLQKSGMSKAEAEELLKNIAQALESSKVSTVQEEKAYMMSKVVESVARDNDGNIVAKLYKDGSFMCSSQLVGAVDMGDGRLNEKIMQQIEKQPNVTVTHYKNKVSDFDLLPEEIVNIKKQLLLPEPYSGYNQTVRKVIAFNEHLLTL